MPSPFRPLAWFLLLCCALVFTACKKHDHGAPAIGSLTPPKATVFVLGQSGDTTKYWKNGIGTVLAGPAGTFGGAQSMSVNGADVYAAGSADASPSSGMAEVWKDGTASTLPNSTGNAGAVSITVSGGDVFVAGVTSYPLTSNVPYTTMSANYPPAGTVATVWKNGVAMNLPGNGYIGLAGGNANVDYSEYVSGILVAGTDVYVAGGSHQYVQGVDSSFQFSKFWKNGVAVNLTKGLVDSSRGQVTGYPVTTGIFVAGNDVYVAGSLTGTAAAAALYWKNGTALLLGQSGFPSGASSVFVAGSDVYVAGFVDSNATSYATYWKNGAKVTLGPNSRGGVASAITVFGQDVYVAGSETVNDTTYVTYWKNGVATHLGTNGRAYSIVVQ